MAGLRCLLVGVTFLEPVTVYYGHHWNLANFAKLITYPRPRLAMHKRGRAPCKERLYSTNSHCLALAPLATHPHPIGTEFKHRYYNITTTGLETRE
jgi:hypothetical protein